MGAHVDLTYDDQKSVDLEVRMNNARKMHEALRGVLEADTLVLRDLDKNVAGLSRQVAAIRRASRINE